MSNVIPSDAVPAQSTLPSTTPAKAQLALAVTFIALGIVLNVAWIGAVLWTAGRALGHLVS